MTDTTFIRKKFSEFRNYRRNRNNEKWEIEQADWIAYFADGDGKGVLESPYGTTLIGRFNATEAWSSANLQIHDKPIRVARRTRKATEGDQAIGGSFAAMGITDKSNVVRVIKLAQWIEELREDAEKA